MNSMDFAKKWILGNWKMNGSLETNQALLSGIKTINANAEIGVAVPYIYLLQASQQLKNSRVRLGAQDLSRFGNDGAYTGEISINMLKDLATQFVLIGHSERRHYFAETDDILLDKFNLARKNNVIPVLCVGETLEQREAGKEYQVIEQQLAILKDIGLSHVVIAYEPVWAIGTGKVANEEQIAQMHEFIYQFILQICAKNVSMRVLYGGSVNAKNAQEILQIKHVDGALVGGASLQLADFAQIIASV